MRREDTQKRRIVGGHETRAAVQRYLDSCVAAQGAICVRLALQGGLVQEHPSDQDLRGGGKRDELPFGSRGTP